MKVSKRHIKSLAECKEITCRNTTKLLKDDRYCTVSVKGGLARNDGYGIPSVKDATEVF